MIDENFIYNIKPYFHMIFLICLTNINSKIRLLTFFLAFYMLSAILANNSCFINFFLVDLVKIFGSRSRVKLLEKLIIEHVVSGSETGFFIRELCRDVDEQINAVRRELINLENLGILKSHEQNKKKYYRINQNCPIYPELKEIFLKTYDLMKPIKEFFK